MELDKNTLLGIFTTLREQEEYRAATIVAGFLVEESALGAWVEMNANNFKHKTDAIKQVREKFGLSLKDAKEVTDKHYYET